MNKTIATALVAAFLFFGATTSQAQAKKPTIHKKTMTIHTKTSTVSNVGSEGNAPADGKSEMQMQAETAGDPLYLNHPYFNGEARWSQPDTLYKHGDFPWAMMQQHPENFRFDAATGRYEMINTAGMGTTTPSR